MAAVEIRSIPVVGPLVHGVALHKVQRLLGYWVLWHSFGSSADVVKRGGMSRTNEFVTRGEFREVFGVDVDEFLPEHAASFAAERTAQGQH